MDNNIQDLINVSRFFGTNPLYIIAGGGNTSYKNEDKVWIKASGSSLASIEEDGFVCLSRAGLKEISKKNYSKDSSTREEEVKADLHNAILYPKEKRPSVETSLHEIMAYPFVVHTHPTLVNALMCSVNAKQLCGELFGQDVLFVEYTDPGYILFKKVMDKIEAFTSKKGFSPKVIFLENHGIFVAGDTTEEIKAAYENISKRLNEKLVTELPDHARNNLQHMLVDMINDVYPGEVRMIARGFSNDLIKWFVKDAQSFDKVAVSYTPDNIVYCKAYYPFIEVPGNEDEVLDYTHKVLNDFKRKHGYAPKVIGLKGQGIIVVEENEKSVNTVYEVILDMFKIGFYAESFGGPKPMTEAQITFIDNWEVENYRRKIAKT